MRYQSVSTQARLRLALWSAIAGATVAVPFVVGHTTHNANTQSQPAQVIANSEQARTSMSDIRIQALKAKAMRILNASARPSDGGSFEFGVYMDFNYETAQQGECKQVSVQSKGGNVVVFNDPDPEVVVLTAKRVIAVNTPRAREYARQLHYTLKKEGDRINVSLSKPADAPRDIFAADVQAIVIAPTGVRVTTNSGG